MTPCRSRIRQALIELGVMVLGLLQGMLLGGVVLFLIMAILAWVLP